MKSDKRLEVLGAAAFAEQYIDGREFNLSVLAGRHGPEVLPPAEIEFIGYGEDRVRIVGYRAKWDERAFEYHHTPRCFDFGGRTGLFFVLSKGLPYAAGSFLTCGDTPVSTTASIADGVSLDSGDQFQPLPFPGQRIHGGNRAGGPPLRGCDRQDHCRHAQDGLIDHVGEKRKALIDEIGLGNNPADHRQAHADGDIVRDIVVSTGLFRLDEIGIAVELVEERLRVGLSSGYHFIFAEKGNTVLGYSCYGPVPLTLNSYDLYWIAVRKEVQGSGIGKMLLSCSEAAMFELGGRRIYIETSSRDLYLRTRRFYESCGYRAEATLRAFYSPGDDKVIYVKPLEPGP